MSAKKKITLVSVFAVVLLSIVTLAATLYPNAKVVFDGITLVSNGSTTQGFVDIYLKDINATGISFCLSYDPDYLLLSDVTTNIPIQNPTSGSSGIAIGPTGDKKYNLEHKFFEQDKTNFPDDLANNKMVFRDIQQQHMVGALAPIIGIADPDNSKVTMNFMPTRDSGNLTTNIQEIVIDNEPYPAIMADGKGDGLRIGRISFQVVDAVGLSKLTDAQLKDVLKIIPHIQMNLPSIAPIDDEGVLMTYFDEDNKVQYYGREQFNIDYDFNIKAELKEVKPQIEEITVSSYEIFKDGTSQDLLDFLNSRMSMLMLTYADGSQVPGVFEWTGIGIDVGSITWNPQGGDYTIKQRYNSSDPDSPEITVKIHVKPVKLTGFDFKNRNITYFYDPANLSNFPANRDDLNLPEKVTPVLDTYIPNGGIPDIPIKEYKYNGNGLAASDLPTGFNSGTNGVYTIEGKTEYNIPSDMESDYKWLTVASLPSIDIIRTVVTDSAKKPKALDVEKCQTDNNGVLTIVVKNRDGTAIPSGTTFDIRMPGGELISSSMFTPAYNADGTATIVLAPDITIDAEKKLAQLINLGNRSGGSFSIASTEPGKSTGPATNFAPNPRRNVYEGPNYTFDYSELQAGLFPVRDSVGYNLPTTLTLPVQTDRIVTVYNGYDGTEKGSLATFTVDNWNFTGDPTVAGNIVSAIGTLSSVAGHDYTNYGTVYNDDGITVTIKYLVIEDPGTESISEIPDYAFNKRQVGYGYDRIQTHTFTITNTGATDIYNLTAVIAPSHDASTTDKEAFVLSQAPISLLNKSGSSSSGTTTFDISTKIGLPVGTYVSTVSILSNNKVLETFNVSFEVTNAPVHDIKLTVNDYSWGTASIGTITTTSTSPFFATASAEEGETVTLVATPTIIPPSIDSEYAFVEWQVISGDITLGDEKSATTTFEMTDGDVEIKAIFKEKLVAKLRASELRVRDINDPDPDSDTTKDLQLYNSTWNAVNFDPQVREYYMALPNSLEDIKLWFRLRTEASAAALSMTHSHIAPPIPTPTPAPDNLTVPTLDTADNYYKSQSIHLDESPTENIVTLNIAWDDPTDNPDEGTKTGSYVFHIYRKISASDLFSFNYGNSPTGRIMRDSSIASADKNTEKTNFINNNYTFLSTGVVPADATADIPYLTEAWGTMSNYDLNDYALFVTDNSVINDPGYSAVQNSIGQTVKASDVSRSVKVKVLSESVPSLKNGSSDDFVHIVSSTFNLTNSGPIMELNGLRIRPDVYNISYSFTDFDGKTTTVDKPLIILSPLGDVNISHTTDQTDITRIKERFKPSLDLADSYSVTTATDDYTAGGLLFKYRICDVNKDGNVNLIDSNYIRAGKTSPFYRDLP